MENLNFETCFGTERTKTKVESIIHDNKAFIKDYYGTVSDYIWYDIENGDQSEYEWMKDECAEYYSRLEDSAEQAVITDMLYDFLKSNYDYSL